MRCATTSAHGWRRRSAQIFRTRDDLLPPARRERHAARDAGSESTAMGAGLMLRVVAHARPSERARCFAASCRASIGSAETCAGEDAGSNPYRSPVRCIPGDARQAAGRSVAPSARDIDDAVRDLDRIRGGRACDRWRIRHGELRHLPGYTTTRRSPDHLRRRQRLHARQVILRSSACR